MTSKFKFSLDSADATARQFSDIKRQLQELPPSIVNSVKPMVDQITKMYEEVQTLTNNLDKRVQESISRNSYTRAEIDVKTQTWNWGVPIVVVRVSPTLITMCLRQALGARCGCCLTALWARLSRFVQ